jgi:hypothetical protein
MTARQWWLSCVVVLLLSSAQIARAQQPSHPGLDAPGFQPNRDYFSQMPFEHVDAASGGLILTFTDLVLPGNAGRELRFQRTYNSKANGWSFGILGYALTIIDPDIPAGVPQDIQERTPVPVLADCSAGTAVVRQHRR